jgi:hypothetical protein
MALLRDLIEGMGEASQTHEREEREREKAPPISQLKRPDTTNTGLWK